MPKISVIVPVYKVEPYLRRCIDSILGQTFRDFELILVDDGSPDGCPVICDEYAKNDSRIKVIHQANQGLSVARNNGVKAAVCRWVSFVDSDDAIHPQMLEHFLRAVETTGARIAMGGTIERAAVPDDFYQDREDLFQFHLVDEEYLMHLYSFVKYKPWMVHSKLIDKDIVIKYPFEPGKTYEDNAVVCKWIDEAKKVVESDELYYYYQINLNGISKSKFSAKSIDYLWALEEIITFCNRVGYNCIRKEFCSKYAIVATDYYYRVKNELGSIEICRGIKKQMKKVLRKNRSSVVLTKPQRLYVMSVLHPKYIAFREAVTVSIKTLREKGFMALFKKVIDRMMRRNKK